MDKVARLPLTDRAALFGETGAGRGVANTIIEKDFWVCWTLKRLFDLPQGAAASLVFKGGTSLSKAFGIIRRFSEDIDLSFDRADLGYSGDRDPEQEGLSRKKTGQLIDDLVADVEKHIAENLLPALRAAIVQQLGEPKNGEWSLSIDADDPQTLNFHYPPALPAGEYQGMAYITPRVKLELGARGDPWPAEQKVIRPYAAEDFPDFFEDPDTTVTVLSAMGSHALHERITIRMTSEMIARIDAWIADQPGYVSRQDAVRHCVDLVFPQIGQERPVSASDATPGRAGQ
jgi:hypothetical protein